MPSTTPETAYRVLGGLHQLHGEVTKSPSMRRIGTTTRGHLQL